MQAILLQGPVVEVEGDWTPGLVDAQATDVKTKKLNTFQTALTAELKNHAIKKVLEKKSQVFLWPPPEWQTPKSTAYRSIIRVG